MKVRSRAARLVAVLAMSAAPLSPASDSADRFGSAAIGMPYDRTIRLSANTRSIGVWRFETINFLTADGREFRWRFDTARELDAFPLGRIAPADLGLPAAATVYVNGEIPIAP